MIDLVIDPRDPELEPLGVASDGSRVRPYTATIRPSRTVRLADGGFLSSMIPAPKPATTSGPVTLTVPATDGAEILEADRATFTYTVDVEVTSRGHSAQGAARMSFTGLLPSSLGASVPVTSLVNAEPLPAPFTSVQDIIDGVADVNDPVVQALVNSTSATRNALDARYVRKGTQVINLADHVSGSGDLTAAIQSFVTGSLTAGDELLIGKGTWRVDGTVTFPQSDITVHLRQGAVIDRSTASSATAGALAFTGDRVTVRGRGSILSPAVWDGTNAAHTNAVVKFTGAKPTCREITLTNVPKYGIGCFNTTGVAKVKDVTIVGNYPAGQWTEVETGHFGVFFDPGTTDSRMKLTDSDIDGCVQGWCGGNLGAGSSVGSVVKNTDFTRCWNHGVYNSGGLTDMVVEGNVFRDCSRPIVMTDSGHIVSNNTLTASGTGSTLFWSAGIAMRNAIDCIVANNVLKGDVFTGAAAIDLSHVSSGTTISGNQITGNRVKLTSANRGYCIRVGTTASTVMARNIIKDNIVEGRGVANFGLISVSAAAGPTDARGNQIEGNDITITDGASGIYATNLVRPKIRNNDIKVEFDSASAVTIGGVSLVGNTVSASVQNNDITCSAAWGANVTVRAIWEWAATVLTSKISDNEIALDPTKLAVATPYHLAAGGPILRATGAGVPSFICGPGSQWLRTDGASGSTLYIKESASNSATWTAK